MDRPLLSLRTTLVFLLALLVGAAAGGLAALAGEGAPRSLLAGLGAAGLAVPFFDRLIDADADADADGGRAGRRDRSGAGTGRGEGRG
ncbi:hypothetical protein ABT097_30900 [Streptomyces sp. NPDC002225]|uniref:hypothetical protein n=1 Tax=Streptomyces sp. NPDC002225 TaxID=3154413 RepID=UPI00331F2500